MSSIGYEGALDCPECGAVCSLRLDVCQVCYAEIQERQGVAGSFLTDDAILDLLFEPDARRSA